MSYTVELKPSDFGQVDQNTYIITSNMQLDQSALDRIAKVRSELQILSESAAKQSDQKDLNAGPANDQKSFFETDAGKAGLRYFAAISAYDEVFKDYEITVITRVGELQKCT